MKGISRRTAIIIATNYPINIVIHSTQNTPKSKLRGWIDLAKNDNFHSQLLSTDEVYENRDDAEKEMKELCEWCVEWYKRKVEF